MSGEESVFGSIRMSDSSVLLAKCRTAIVISDKMFGLNKNFLFIFVS
jgi:hypothetical protein